MKYVEEKEHYTVRLKKEKRELVDAVEAVVLFHKALDHYQTGSYKGDRLREVERSKAEWYRKLALVKPYLEEKK